MLKQMNLPADTLVLLVDDVDLEVQRLLSVYDLVKDEESLSRLAQVLLHMKLIFIII